MQTALILHHYPFQEDSVLLKVFTGDGILVPVIARGAKRPRSQWRSVIRPFVLSQLHFSGKGEVKSLKQCESEHAFDFSPAALPCGFYLNELLLYFLRQNDAHPDLFVCYTQALAALEEGDIEVALRTFELKLLAALGFGVPLHHDAAHALIEAEGFYRMVPGHLPERVATLSGRGICAGRSLLAMAKFEWTDKAVRTDAKRLMRAWIHFYMDGKVLKSKKLLMS
jgi:DNA repair protein RecO (recombination protein O)